MASTRKPYLATNYHDMMRHIYAKPKGHSEGLKPYMSDTYTDMEYPQLDYYDSDIPVIPDAGGGGDDNPPTPPNECLEWFYTTLYVTGKTYYTDPAYIQSLYDNAGECEKLHLVILSCLQMNSLSFCACCASMGLPHGTCDEDYGAAADQPGWRCCDDPCPSFDIGIELETATTICYEVNADCDISVRWEKKVGTDPWVAMETNCTDKPTCSGIVRAIDWCGNEVTADLPGTTASEPGVISCSGTCDEVVKSTTKQYTYTPCTCESGTAVWAVSGTGASISQSGLLTTTAAACGTLTITVTMDGCTVATQEVRVTNGGTWTQTSYTEYCHLGTESCFINPCTRVGSSYVTYSCDYDAGGTRSRYYGQEGCSASSALVCKSFAYCITGAPLATLTGTPPCRTPCADCYGGETRYNLIYAVRVYAWVCP